MLTLLLSISSFAKDDLICGLECQKRKALEKKDLKKKELLKKEYIGKCQSIDKYISVCIGEFQTCTILNNGISSSISCVKN